MLESFLRFLHRKLFNHLNTRKFASVGEEYGEVVSPCSGVLGNQVIVNTFGGKEK